MRLPPDVIDLLRAFADAEVRYVLIGGYAVAFHAEPRFTKDVDLWLDQGDENIERAQRALRQFGAPEQTTAALAEARGLDVVWMGNPPTRIDLMKEVPGGADFAAVYGRRLERRLDEVNIHVIHRDDLIELKRASGRPQDLADVSALERAAKR